MNVNQFIDGITPGIWRTFARKYLAHLRGAPYPQWHASHLPDTDRERIEDELRRLRAGNAPVGQKRH